MWPFKKKSNTFLNLIHKMEKQERRKEKQKRKPIEITPGMSRNTILAAVLYDADLSKEEFQKSYRELKEP